MGGEGLRIQSGSRASRGTLTHTGDWSNPILAITRQKTEDSTLVYHILHPKRSNTQNPNHRLSWAQHRSPSRLNRQFITVRSSSPSPSRLNFVHRSCLVFQVNKNPIDIDKTKEVLEPEKSSCGGLHLPGNRKERVVFRQPERKSLLGLDVLANAKRARSHVDGSFKVPKEKISSMLASMDDEVENISSSVTGPDEVEGGANSSNAQNSTSRRYRDSSGTKTYDSESQLTEERVGVASSRHGSKSSSYSEYT
ncbi:hypothetical protein R6Q59_016283 [Mikania micrantha]